MLPLLSLLAAGETEQGSMLVQVPNLFAKDEIMTIIEAVTPKAKRAGRGITPAEVYAFFVEQCRANLHMVLAMSPVGDAFRSAAYSTLLHLTVLCTGILSSWLCLALLHFASFGLLACGALLLLAS